MLAVLASVVLVHQLDFLDTLDGEGAVAVFRALLTLEGTRTLSDNKVARLALRLAAARRGSCRRHAPGVANLGQPDRLGHRTGGHRTDADGHAAHLNLVVASLPAELLAAFLKLLPFVSGFPYDAETDLVLLLRGHDDADVSTWARRRLGEGTAVAAPAVVVAALRRRRVAQERRRRAERRPLRRAAGVPR